MEVLLWAERPPPPFLKTMQDLSILLLQAPDGQDPGVEIPATRTMETILFHLQEAEGSFETNQVLQCLLRLYFDGKPITKKAVTI